MLKIYTRLPVQSRQQLRLQSRHSYFKYVLYNEAFEIIINLLLLFFYFFYKYLKMYSSGEKYIYDVCTRNNSNSIDKVLGF